MRGRATAAALWLAAELVLAAAVLGKIPGVWMEARAGGVPEREAQTLGWLMNTCGLTELVVLNAGLNLGVISSQLFSMGVLMALITTAMAGALLERLGYGHAAPPRDL